jgi:hypothetical protein
MCFEVTVSPSIPLPIFGIIASLINLLTMVPLPAVEERLPAEVPLGPCTDLLWKFNSGPKPSEDSLGLDNFEG